MSRIPFENSKFEKVRIRFLISEKTKSKIQVGDAKPKDEAKYPFFTSGENILSFDEFLCDNQTIFLNDGGVAGVKFYDGKVAYSDHTYAICSKNENICFTKFLFYSILCNLNFIDFFFFKGSALRNLEKNKFKNFKIPLPPLNEQKKIAEFLDKKCEIIDKRLSNLERKIKSLKEYKKSLISECVTKGLNPKNKEFKDSGIPWIGQIPKHWEVTKIKMYYKVILGKMLANNPSSIDDTLENYLSAINIKFEGVNTSEQKQMFFNKREKELYLLKQGDVLISEGGDAGTACVYNNEFYPCYIQNAVHKVITKNSKKAINKFLYYWIFFIKSVGYVNLICNKATLMHFTKEKVENNFIFLPPLNEQKEITEFLDKKCEKIDRLNENYTKQITALKEYKKSLIYECVTGKKEI